ncbi:Cof-type HAD-IIB family hydrolase [Halalkalibacter oceani]|uniref:Cof-type HAD-IIB family hydrolase n=1 Tax=Halalkalibacter oceani TaxID=1653776 RepID=A0A9X2DL96_9BACI|nr:Cof-type HAD-IIB family hydrolase [Halalkalibacter oceani]MCM3712619.1 Cof-type HAD-IIB family hydrolase [Halalkalibacter oceani]
MTYRLLALNIDGTLLKANARIARQTKDAIDYVKQKGVYVTLATSRPFPSAKKVAKSLKLSSYLITNDGAFVASSNKEPLFVRAIPTEIAIQITDFLEQYECHIRVLHEDHATGNRVRQKSNLIAKMTVGVGDPLYYPISFVDSVSEQLLKDASPPPKIQVQFFHDSEELKAIQQIKKQVKGIHVMETGAGRYDFIHAEASKARGLSVLGQHLGIEPSEMVAIGAYDNDVEMISQAGLGVAMGNATPAVKEAADWLTRSNEQNGVSYMIREVFRKQLRVQL